MPIILLLWQLKYLLKEINRIDIDKPNFIIVFISLYLKIYGKPYPLMDVLILFFFIFLDLILSFFLNFILFLNFTKLYWFCQISKWIHHRYICVPHPEPSSLLPPHTIPLGRPSAPAPSIQYHASNLDWPCKFNTGTSQKEAKHAN